MLPGCEDVAENDVDEFVVLRRILQEVQRNVMFP